MKRCCVLGLGYIGLPTAAILADSGYEVFGYDIKSEIVDRINNSEIHIIENNLLELVQKVVKSKKLLAIEKLLPADIFLIAVPTPLKKNINAIPEPDISFVLNAAKKIANVLKKGNLVIIESTSPVNTTNKVLSLLSNESGLDINDFHLCYCPERVLPGKILDELKTNDRVIGCQRKNSGIIAKNFYKTFCKGKIMLTSFNTAELCKLAENAYRDVNIAYANELSMICEEFSVDVRELINLTNLHPRVNILNPGCGVGGHCIAVDPWFIASEAPENSNLIQTARRINKKKVNWTVEKVKKEVSIFTKKNSRNPIIACLGLAFKPNIDDYRESPALEIFKELLSQGLDVIACDPNIKDINSIEIKGLDHVIEKSDLIVALVAHDSFKKIEFKDKVIIDICGLTN